MHCFNGWAYTTSHVAAFHFSCEKLPFVNAIYSSRVTCMLLLNCQAALLQYRVSLHGITSLACSSSPTQTDAAFVLHHPPGSST